MYLYIHVFKSQDHIICNIYMYLYIHHLITDLKSPQSPNLHNLHNLQPETISVENLFIFFYFVLL